MAFKQAQKIRSVWLAILLATGSLTLSACLEPPASLKSGKATLAIAQRIAAGTDGFDDPTTAARPDMTGPGVIALGIELASDLKLNLQAQGLTLQQATAIADKANAEVRASVIAITVDNSDESLQLTDGETAKSALQIAAPLIVKGATKALDDDDVGLPKEQRGDTLAGVVGSSFKSMNGRTDGLEAADLAQLSKSLVAVAVQSLPEAGMGEADAGAASQSITRGAVSALGESGMSSAAFGDVVSAVVSGTVSGFASLNLGDDAVRAVAANATSGAIASLSSTGLSAEASVAVMGEVASSSISALQSFSQGASLVTSVASDVAASAIQALQGSEVLASGRLADAVKTIAQGAVEGLKDTGMATSDLTQGASAIAAGAIKGLATTASNEQLSAGGLAEAALSGTFSAMATADNMSDSAKSELMATVVEKAVANLAETSSTDVKKALLGEVVSAAVSGMKTLGMDSVSSVQTTLQAVSEKATQSLVAAGFAATDLSAATQVLTNATVKSLDNVGLENVSATDIKAMVTVVVSGVSSGLDQLSTTGQIAADVKEATLSSSATAAATAVSTLQVTQQLSTAEQTALVQATQTSLATVVKPVIRYNPNQYILAAGQAVSIQPVVEGAAPTSCRVTPALPPGLILSNDCKLSGTPTTAFAVNQYQITPATDKGDGDAQVLQLAIAPPLATLPPLINSSTSTWPNSSTYTSTATWPNSSTYTSTATWPNSSTYTSTATWSGPSTYTSTATYSGVYPATATWSGSSTYTSTATYFATSTAPAQIAYTDSSFTINGTDTVSIMSTQLTGFVTGCASNQPLPPGLFLMPNCSIYGQIDFYSSDDYQPINCSIQDINGFPLADGDCATRPTVAEYQYVIPFEITPFNSINESGAPQELTLVIRPPSSIYTDFSYHYMTNTAVAISIEPQINSVPEGASCWIVNLQGPSLPGELTFDTSSCTLSGFLSPPVPWSKYRVTLNDGANSSHSVFSLAVYQSLNVMVETTTDNAHVISWSSVDPQYGTVLYSVFAGDMPEPPSSPQFPNPAWSPVQGAWINPWGELIYVGNNTSTTNTSVMNGAQYFYTVFARILPSAPATLPGPYIGKGTSVPVFEPMN